MSAPRPAVAAGAARGTARRDRTVGPGGVGHLVLPGIAGCTRCTAANLLRTTTGDLLAAGPTR